MSLAENPRARLGGNQPPDREAPVLYAQGKIARTIRLVAGMVEGAYELPPGTVLAPGRGDARKQIAVHLFVYVLLKEFRLPVVSTATAIKRDRGHMRKSADEVELKSGHSERLAVALTKFGGVAKDYVEACHGIGDRRVKL